MLNSLSFMGFIIPVNLCDKKKGLSNGRIYADDDAIS